MDRRHLKAKAREFREKGWSLNKLQEHFKGIPKSTLYYWVRDIEVTPHQGTKGRGGSGQAKATRAMQEKYRLLREAAYSQGEKEFPELMEDPTFRDFLCLYLGEGYKKNRNVVSIVNSSPHIMGLAMSWLRRLSDKPESEWRIAIRYHLDHDPEYLKSFWSRYLNVPESDFTMQPKASSTNMSTRNHRCQHGILYVEIGSTSLRQRLQAWMDLLQASWGLPSLPVLDAVTERV